MLLLGLVLHLLVAATETFMSALVTLHFVLASLDNLGASYCIQVFPYGGAYGGAMDHLDA